MTDNLTGPELDLRVAEASGLKGFIDGICYAKKPNEIKYYHFSPSTNPAQGLPIVEELAKRGIVIRHTPTNVYVADLELHDCPGWERIAKGNTYLEAACRAYVAMMKDKKPHATS